MRRDTSTAYRTEKKYMLGLGTRQFCFTIIALIFFFFFLVYYLPLLHLVVPLGFYLVPLSGTYSSTILFHLTFMIVISILNAGAL